MVNLTLKEKVAIFSKFHYNFSNLLKIFDFDTMNTGKISEADCPSSWSEAQFHEFSKELRALSHRV